MARCFALAFRRPVITYMVLAAALLSPACAFWSMADWSDREGAAPGGSEAEAEARASGRDAGFCNGAGDASLFCDDFDTPGVVWTDAEVCATCVARVVTPEAGAASPPSALFVESHSIGANQQGAAYLLEAITGAFDIATVRFALYVERADPTSEAAVQELALEDGDGPRLRSRLWLGDGTARLETVSSTPEPKNVYENVVSMPLGARAWHRFHITMSRTPGPGYVSMSVDEALVVDRHAIAGGERVNLSFPRLVFRNGVRYLGVPPDPAGFRLYFDDVALSVP
jgi:hypothetical protein